MLETSIEQQLSIQSLQLQKAALVYRAINHPLRMQMLALLHKHSEMKVTDLYTRLRLEQSVASQHLAILRRAGFAITRRDGKNVYYSVDYDRLQQVHRIAEKLNR